MAPDSERRQRRSIRLKGFDYREPGVYFVTICTANRQSVFGAIVDGAMALNEFGKVVEAEWHRSAIVRPQIRLDAFVVMPNHVHGVICLNEAEGKARLAPTPGQFRQLVRGSLGMIVGAFKSASTKRINEIRGTPGALLWQRNYFEHVIRHEEELNRVREYIAANPVRWSEDGNNPNQVVASQPQSEFDQIFVGARRALPLSVVRHKF